MWGSLCRARSLSLGQGSGKVQECEEPRALGLRVLEHG